MILAPNRWRLIKRTRCGSLSVNGSTQPRMSKRDTFAGTDGLMRFDSSHSTSAPWLCDSKSCEIQVPARTKIWARLLRNTSGSTIPGRKHANPASGPCASTWRIKRVNRAKLRGLPLPASTGHAKQSPSGSLNGSLSRPSRWWALTTAFHSRCNISRSTACPTTGHLSWTIFKSTGRQMRTTPTSISFVKASAGTVRLAVGILAGGESQKSVRVRNPFFILMCPAPSPNQHMPAFRGCVFSARAPGIESISGHLTAGGCLRWHHAGFR